MQALLLELIPHAPNLGLYTVPHIPADHLRNALDDYAGQVHREEVLALYDATLLGNAKDGAVFTADRLVFQNNNLEAAQTVRYADVVQVSSKRKLLGGREVILEVNRGRATITLKLDFSGKADAARYVERFLNEAMVRGAAAEMEKPEERGAQTSSGSDKTEVQAALGRLRASGALTKPDYQALTDVLDRL